MANIFDYLKWRGDLTFANDPFNEVDNLILSCIAYIPFDDIVPEDDETVTLRRAAHIFFSSEEHRRRAFIHEGDRRLFVSTARSRRFGGLRLSRYVNHISEEEQKQFSAVTIRMGGTTFIAFRGTDDTIVGWKEDFNMGFLSATPSQLEAVAYLNGAPKEGALIVGGHSKGGNLAVYASALCERAVQDRITAVYNNDGPGFTTELLHSDGYARIQDRVNTIVPQLSIIGMLFEHGDHRVVKSTGKGLWQHLMYNWLVMPTAFREADDVTRGSHLWDTTFSRWIGEMDDDARRKFADALFDVIRRSGATTFTEFAHELEHSMLSYVKRLRKVDAPTRHAVTRALNRLLVIAGRAAVDVALLGHSPERVGAEHSDAAADEDMGDIDDTNDI